MLIIFSSGILRVYRNGYCLQIFKVYILWTFNLKYLKQTSNTFYSSQNVLKVQYYQAPSIYVLVAFSNNGNYGLIIKNKQIINNNDLYWV